MKKLYILNGPNLDLLGVREPGIYGTVTLSEIKENLGEDLQTQADLDFFQTNSEREMVEKLHAIFLYACENFSNIAGVILNPAAFTHYSYAVADALKMVVGAGVKVIELHLSNPQARETFRHNSVVSPYVTGTIAGLGARGYRLAADFLLS